MRCATTIVAWPPLVTLGIQNPATHPPPSHGVHTTPRITTQRQTCHACLLCGPSSSAKTHDAGPPPHFMPPPLNGFSPNLSAASAKADISLTVLKCALFTFSPQPCSCECRRASRRTPGRGAVGKPPLSARRAQGCTATSASSHHANNHKPTHHRTVRPHATVSGCAHRLVKVHVPVRRPKAGRAVASWRKRAAQAWPQVCEHALRAQ
eukprot:3990636-Prymnesium_polylepis.2